MSRFKCQASLYILLALLPLLNGCTGVGTPTGNPPGDTTTNKLVAYYPLDGDAKDQSGNGYNGIVYGATPAPDRFGAANSAYSFDGINDKIVTTQEHFKSVNNVSVSVWVNATPGEGLAYFLMCSDFGMWSQVDTLGMAISLPSTNSAAGSAAAGSWVHFVGTYDGTTIRAFVNGQLQQNMEWAGTVADLGRALELGSFSAGTTIFYWSGILDDVKIYNYVLSSADILALYNASKP